MKEFNRLMEYREYYIYDTENEVFCIATGPKHNEALELYTQIVDAYFRDEHNRWEFEVALDCVHNFSEEDINTIRKQGRIFRYHHGYGMYVRNHYVYSSKKDSRYMADGISGTVEDLIYTIVLPVYNCFAKEFMQLMGDFDFRDIQEQYGDTHPAIQSVLAQLAKPDSTMTAEEALNLIRSGIRASLSPKGFQEIAIPIALEHIEKYGSIHKEPSELVNAMYSKTKVYHRNYNQLQAIINMYVPTLTMEPCPKLKTLEETRDYIMDNLGINEEDAMCMAECAMAISKKQREVLDNDPNNSTRELDELLKKIKSQPGQSDVQITETAANRKRPLEIQIFPDYEEV